MPCSTACLHIRVRHGRPQVGRLPHGSGDSSDCDQVTVRRRPGPEPIRPGYMADEREKEGEEEKINN